MMLRYGGAVQLQKLKPEQVDVRDIIHGLAHTNRFNGQSAIPITVLWHSLMLMQLCSAHGRATELEALFHDAADTYGRGRRGWAPPTQSTSPTSR